MCFGPDGVKVYQDLKLSVELLMKGQEIDSIYVMLVEDTYMDKQRHTMKESILIPLVNNAIHQEML